MTTCVAKLLIHASELESTSEADVRVFNRCPCIPTTESVNGTNIYGTPHLWTTHAYRSRHARFGRTATYKITFLPLRLNTTLSNGGCASKAPASPMSQSAKECVDIRKPLLSRCVKKKKTEVTSAPTFCDSV